MAIRKIKLTISYDGSKYSGWQNQPGKRTIQGELERAVSDLTGFATKVAGASRTDAGVSALGQAAVIEINSPIPTQNLRKAITNKLPKEIAITEVLEVPADFEISSVKSKLYRYTIYTGRNRPVLNRHCWHIPAKLNQVSMAEAAGSLAGKKDFKSFASAADKRESSVRTIFRCDVSGDGDWIYIDVEGDGFLYNMVRNIVGTLVEIGRGRWAPAKMQEIIDSKDRTAAGPIAPPEGLCLIRIEY